MKMHRASALLMALWVIAVLSVMVLSFATEAHLQSGINVFVRERNRVNRLVEAAQVLAEIVITGYSSVSEWNEDQDDEKLLEDDRWYLEKQDLKEGRPCRIGPILIDETNPESGMVTIDINVSRKINVNELFEGGDSKYKVRWEMILTSHGIPEDYEIETDDGTFLLIDHLIACWNDWRDENDSITEINGKACGAESEWYEEFYEDDNVDEEYRRYPRNSSIPDIRELSYIRGFRDYPAVLQGGILNPEDDKDDQIQVAGIAELFGTTGSAKINVNDRDLTEEQLLTIPGIYDEEDEDGTQAKGHEIAQAIILGRTQKPENYDVDESRGWWPYRDIDDVKRRMEEFTSEDLGEEASQYFVFKPDDTTLFDIQISCETMGMARRIAAKAYVKDGEVRYVEWEEDPKETKEESTTTPTKGTLTK